MRFGRSKNPDNQNPENVEHSLDMAWELFEAQPTHPKVAKLVTQVLAAQPERSSAALLLGMHHEMSERTDEARRVYQQVAGRRDNQFISAARCLRQLALHTRDHADALHWAGVALEEGQEDWDDWMELGSALLGVGELDDGWRQLDDAVAMCARTDPDQLPAALEKRATSLLSSFAPPEQFVPAAEEAMRAEVASPWVALLLGWAYAAQYRFADAEQVALRLLRDDPTQELFHNLLGMVQTVQQTIEGAADEGITLEDIKRSGVLETSFQQLREQAIGIDLGSALAALDQVMPAELRASLGAPAAEAEDAGAIAGERLVTWHDGQQPGTASTWGAGWPYRLMSTREMADLDRAIEADPAAYTEWPQNEAWEQVMTDDAGSHLVVVAFGALVRRRAGQPDEPVAPSMADWIWDRVVAFGGADPRPPGRPAPGAAEHGDASPDQPQDVPGRLPAGAKFLLQGPEDPPLADNDPAMITELNRLTRANEEAAEGDMAPEKALWTHVSHLERWFFINMGTSERPRPHWRSWSQGSAVCLYSSAARAQEAARTLGLVPDGADAAPLYAVTVPDAIDYLASFEDSGFFGVTLDEPFDGHYIPLSNMALLKRWLRESMQAPPH